MALFTPASPTTTRITKPTHALGLWHLLSLDAPTVATLWTWFVARTIHLTLPTAGLLGMFFAVWMLYAADRLLDARQLFSAPLSTEHLEARHLFHHRHRTIFLTGIVAASTILAFLLPRLRPAVIHLYLILGVFLAGYFILIHASDHRLPKEIAVGIFFAAATFIPTVGNRPNLRLALLPSAILFSAVCSLNCLFIYAWEHEDPHHISIYPPTYPQAHPITRIALRHLPLLSLIIVAAGLTSAILHQPTYAIPLAAALSSALLLILHCLRHTLSPITLRASADLALLTPLLWLLR
ncbi:hypothetical protein [Granulicella sp. L60]|jgi:hypothetical protein|uniref:hypothetical protein n=1 Tax=Granulicella sp. L60 TaxID=1641866 RepID=UPI00131BB0AA|nr:hypothetical protein [Granulicella sp. L60]